MGTFERTLQRWRDERRDREVFETLGRAHGLSRRQRRLLVDLADHYRLVRIAEVYLRPGLFRQTPDPRLLPAAELHDIARTLFVGKTDPPPAGDVPGTASPEPSPPSSAAEPGLSEPGRSRRRRGPFAGIRRMVDRGFVRRLRRQPWPAEPHPTEVPRAGTPTPGEPEVQAQTPPEVAGIQLQSVEDPRTPGAPPTARE